MAFATYLKAAAAAACLLTASPAAAAVIYEHALFNGPDGGPYSNDPSQIVAEAFELDVNADVARVAWFGAGLESETFGDFRIRFYEESDETPDRPGGVIAMTTVSAYGKTDTGLINSYGDRVFRFTAAVPVFHAIAGYRYFFSVADIGPANFIWSLAPRDCCAVFNMNGYGWARDDARASNAFGLYLADSGVPEPATWAVLVLGFMASGAMLRRRRAIPTHA